MTPAAPTYLTVRTKGITSLYASWLPSAPVAQFLQFNLYGDEAAGDPFANPAVLTRDAFYSNNYWTGAPLDLQGHSSGVSLGVTALDPNTLEESGPSNVAIWVGDGSVTYPNQPTGVTQYPAPQLIPAGGPYQVHWNEQGGVVGYKVYVQSEAPEDNSGILLAVVLYVNPGGTLTWNDPEVSNVRGREYYVTAFDSNWRESHELLAVSGPYYDDGAHAIANIGIRRKYRKRMYLGGGDELAPPGTRAEELGMPTLGNPGMMSYGINTAPRLGTRNKPK